MNSTEYLTETVLFGGLPSTRATIIATLQAEGHSQALIDRYLQGLDLGLKLRRR